MRKTEASTKTKNAQAEGGARPESEANSGSPGGPESVPRIPGTEVGTGPWTGANTEVGKTAIKSPEESGAKSGMPLGPWGADPIWHLQALEETEAECPVAQQVTLTLVLQQAIAQDAFGKGAWQGAASLAQTGRAASNRSSEERILDIETVFPLNTWSIPQNGSRPNQVPVDIIRP